MSAYGLIKATSRIMRTDTMNDLFVVNNWRLSKGISPVVVGGPSVRKLENAVALAIEGLDISDLPKLVRDSSFYLSILPEIKANEREHFLKVNRSIQQEK